MGAGRRIRRAIEGRGNQEARELTTDMTWLADTDTPNRFDGDSIRTVL